ncbi:ferredoxin [Aliiroseovarius sp. F47248L]|uniref:ferredoxin n=1 Tax=Aliiroseovarius sp. F47248L TaxID=2926420 RepID=UPI001FF528F0|nr:ferredoxin [Aliiroseovarius sp. F47248L]MCK0137518.1 ferredoxin [Aliiroseovarius sp. F47248L]
MARRQSIKAGLEPDAAVSTEVTIDTLTRDVRARQMDVFGALHDGPDTVILLGPYEPGFWACFIDCLEYADGLPDPMDRWSKSVISDLADRWAGQAIFPSDGPPYPPFFDWALQSERAWKSPVTLLVHDTAGLWVSYRGAVRLSGHLDLPPTEICPCDGCSAPCRTACPVSALEPERYDVDTCLSHLNGADSADCMETGCAARRACPISLNYGRLAAQSAFHMKAFNPT